MPFIRFEENIHFSQLRTNCYKSKEFKKKFKHYTGSKKINFELITFVGTKFNYNYYKYRKL